MDQLTDPTIETPAEMTRIIGLLNPPISRSFKLTPFVCSKRVDDEIAFFLHGASETPMRITEEEVQKMAEEGKLRMLRMASVWWDSSGNEIAGTLINALDWTGVKMVLPSCMTMAALNADVMPDHGTLQWPQLVREPLVAVWLGRMFEQTAIAVKTMAPDFRDMMLNAEKVEIEFNDGSEQGVLAIMKRSDAEALFHSWLTMPAAIIKGVVDTLQPGATLEGPQARVMRTIVSLVAHTVHNHPTVLAIRAAAANIGLTEASPAYELTWQMQANMPIVRRLWAEWLESVWDAIPSLADLQRMNAEASAQSSDLPEGSDDVDPS